jgi:hypothetical protein
MSVTFDILCRLLRLGGFPFFEILYWRNGHHFNQLPSCFGTFPNRGIPSGHLSFLVRLRGDLQVMLSHNGTIMPRCNDHSFGVPAWRSQ